VKIFQSSHDDLDSFEEKHTIFSLSLGFKNTLQRKKEAINILSPSASNGLLYK
jgi:hypothetical protein